MKKIVYKLAGLFSVLSTTQSFADDAVGGRQNGGMSTFVVLGMALVLFYFILWRPEQKRRKTVEQQRSSMKVGDRVTAMGIVGTVAKIPEQGNTVILKMCEGAKIEVLKASITDVQSGSGESSTEEKTS